MHRKNGSGLYIQEGRPGYQGKVFFGGWLGHILLFLVRKCPTFLVYFKALVMPPKNLPLSRGKRARFLERSHRGEQLAQQCVGIHQEFFIEFRRYYNIFF